MTTVREAAYEVLRAAGVDRVFGNPGSTELPFLQDFPEDFSYVLGLHEAAVVGMADGYAQGGGGVAFVNVHTAAGLGNAMGAIVNAAHNRTPIVVTAGQQDRRQLARKPRLAGRLVELARPYVKWSNEPGRAQDVPAALARACHIARQEPSGPVFLSIPMDDWAHEAEPIAARSVTYRALPEPAALADAAAVLDGAHRPALVTGFGVDRAGAWDEVVALAERLGADVWADPIGIRAGFPQDHPLFRGHLPAGQAPLAEQLAAHDTVLVLGTPAFEYLPHLPGPSLDGGTRVLQITEDPADASRAEVGTALVGDVKLAVAALLHHLGDDGRRWSGPRPEPAPAPPLGALTAEHLMHALGRLLPPDSILVEESPSTKDAMRRHVRIRRPGGYTMSGSGGLGFAMPAAVGMKLAAPERPVVCLIGDGSSMYSPQALWSAARYDVAVAVVVVNNGQYTILKSFGELLGVGQGIPGLDLPGIDVLGVAAGLGCDGRRVTEPDELSPALEHALSARGPYVLDVHVDTAVPRMPGLP